MCESAASCNEQRYSYKDNFAMQASYHALNIYLEVFNLAFVHVLVFDLSKTLYMLVLKSFALNPGEEINAMRAR